MYTFWPSGPVMYSMNLMAWALTWDFGISAMDHPPAHVDGLSPALGTGMYVKP